MHKAWNTHLERLLDHQAVCDALCTYSYADLLNTPCASIPWLYDMLKGISWMAPPRSGLVPQGLKPWLLNHPGHFSIQSTGTTGEPKWLVFNQEKFLNAYALKTSSSSNLILIGYEPWHIGFIDAALKSWAGGHTVIIPPAYTAVGLTEAGARYQPHTVCCSSLMLWMLFQSDASWLAQVKRIVLGGMAAQPGMLRAIRLKYPHIEFLETFGSSETGVIATYECNTGFIPEGKLRITDIGFAVKAHPALVGFWTEQGFQALEPDAWLESNDTFIPVESGWKWNGRAGSWAVIAGQRLNLTELEQAVSGIKGLVYASFQTRSHPVFGQLLEARCLAEAGVTEEELKISLRSSLKEKIGTTAVPTFISIQYEMALNDRGKPDWR